MDIKIDGHNFSFLTLRIPYLICLIFILSSIGNFCFGDNLNSSTDTGSSTTTETGTYVDVASTTLNIGSSTSDVTKVMVIATFEVCIATGGSTNDRLASFRLADATNSIYSIAIDRQLEKEKNGDKGIGSQVHIFDVSSYSGDIIFKLQHTTDNGSYDNTTTGTIVAIALGTTTNHIQLDSDVKSITSPISVGDNAYTTVTGLETSAISLPVSGAIYIATAIQSQKTTGVSEIGYWKIQQRKGASGTWTDIGNEISRSVTAPDDEGIACIGLISTGLASDDYYYRLQHKGPASPSILTLNTTLIAVALSYNDPANGGRAFPAFSTTSSSSSTISATYVNALSQVGTPDNNTDMFFYAQYNMSASDALDAPYFDLNLTGSGYAGYTSQEQQRRLANGTETGSGASVGLAESLLSSTEYTAALRHKSDGTVNLTTSNVILSGFQTTDQASEGYWTGSTSTVWNNTGNWLDATIPTSATNVSIYDKSNDPAIGVAANCKNLYIASGSVTISPIYSLTVAEDITNNAGDGGLVIESDASNNGSLIVSGTSTGNITYNRYMTGASSDPWKWHLISSSVGGQDLNETFLTNINNAIATNGGNYGLAPYNNSTPGWDHYTTASPPSTTFTSGKGYEIARTEAGTVSFTGTIATDNVSIGITFPSGKSPWNLVGNPYPSAICANNAATTATTATNNLVDINTSVLGAGAYQAIYVWDANAGTPAYITINQAVGATYIAPGQSFFVNSLNESGSSFQFTEAMQTHQTGDIFKSEIVENPSIKLFAERSEGTSSTNIKYFENTTTGLDPGYDAGRFSGGDNSFAVYTHLVGDIENTVDFDIQCLPYDEYNHVVPIGLNAPENTEVVFRAQTENLPEDVPVYLEDKLTGELSALHEAGSFYATTITEQSEGIGRFYVYTKPVVTGISLLDKESVFTIIPRPHNNSIRIIGTADNNTRLAIYDVSGRQLTTNRLTNSETNDVDMAGLRSGIYIVTISSSTQKVSKKISWIKSN